MSRKPMPTRVVAATPTEMKQWTDSLLPEGQDPHYPGCVNNGCGCALLIGMTALALSLTLLTITYLPELASYLQNLRQSNAPSEIDLFGPQSIETLRTLGQSLVGISDNPVTHYLRGTPLCHLFP